MNFQSCLFLTLALTSAYGKVVRYSFEVSYISGTPDGVWTDSILGINGAFPGPLIEADAGDTLEIEVINSIQDGQNVTLHWHGILQRGTPFEDGPAQITQCPIKYGSYQVYRFEVPMSGTYWYHSHVNSQYTEGLWGVMIIRSRDDVYRHFYDKELLITLNDWYHTSGHENEKWLISPESRGAPPYPSSALMNGVGRYPCNYARDLGYLCNSNAQKRPVFSVERGKTYRIRLVNTAGWTAFNFTVEGHTITAIEVDGLETYVSGGTIGDAVHIAAGQRYSLLIRTSWSAPLGSRFLIRASLRREFLFTLPNNLNRFPEALIGEVTGVLQYASGASTAQLIEPQMETFDYTSQYSARTWESLSFLKEEYLIPYSDPIAPTRVDKSLELDIVFEEDADGIRRGSFNNRPFEFTDGKPLLSKFIENATIPKGTFPFVVNYGDVVEIVVNNPERGPHPIHLHGHHFFIMGSGQVGDGNYDPQRHRLTYRGVKRDTAMIHEFSWLVIRFVADNPGVWTLHCHVDWHMLTGMMMTIIEAPELSGQLSVPDEARRVCAEQGVRI